MKKEKSVIMGKCDSIPLDMKNIKQMLGRGHRKMKIKPWDGKLYKNCTFYGSSN